MDFNNKYNMITYLKERIDVRKYNNDREILKNEILKKEILKREKVPFYGTV
ncbi:hypothetical protein [Clostridium tertium]|uniref:hypothetical protein n=2 Tax=Clostridium TaxID=1485 RepID=UPI0024B369A1|nr:hypothetical protein [Clostridium tertium]MDI9219272.1 hypothetical protein [Clostridium tertium]